MMSYALAISQQNSTQPRSSIDDAETQPMFFEPLDESAMPFDSY